MDDQTIAARPFETGPFTDASSQAFGGDGGNRDPRLDNQPPLAERVMLEFEEDLDRLGVKKRIDELLASAANCPETIETEELAGKVGDFVRLSRDVERKIDEARETHNRPLIDARTQLKAKADALYGPLGDTVVKLRARLNAYVQREEAKAAEQRRKAEEEARRIREEEERRRTEAVDAGRPVEELPPAPIVEAAPVAKPIARGNYGSSVSGRTVWKAERLVPNAKLPKNILENAQVTEAIDKVIAAMVRAGTREIKGVRIYETTEATVR